MRFPAARAYLAGELERRAEEVLRARLPWPPPIPVEIEVLVEQEPGVLLDVLQGLKGQCGVIGLVRHEPEANLLRVLIDADVADHPSAHFYRFTVAEEFAHILLHREIMTQIRNAADLAALHDWGGYATIDRNAKRLAAALLMPAVTVSREARALYQQLVGKIGFKDQETVHAQLVKQLARDCLVSAAAMRHRLKEWPLRITQKVERAMRQQLDFLE